MRDLLVAVAERSIRYIEGIDDRGVFPSCEAIDRLEQLNEPFPDSPTDPETVLGLLDEVGSPATVATTGGRYFGFVVGGSLPAALAANLLAGVWDQNAAFDVLSPVAAALEQIALRWLLEALSLPEGTGGGFVTGTTMANLTALAAARHALLQNLGWDVEAQGLFDAPLVTVVVDEEVHISVLKALSLLGLGRDRVVRVPVDGQGRMLPDALPDTGAVWTGGADRADVSICFSLCGRSERGRLSDPQRCCS